ncbi:MAG: 50S ribosomal protein L9 [bacterium]
MEIILLEKVNNVGDLGTLVNVKAGFARNYLIPQGKAKQATAANIAEFEARRAELEASAKAAKTQAENRAETLKDLVITITANAGQEGKLFGSVGNIEIANAISETGHTVERSEVRMPDGPLRMVGEYEVDLHLHTEVDTQIKIVIEAED